MNYLVIDLEMCNVPRDYRSRSYKYANETIQIGAVLLDEEFKRIGTLSQYVHPEHGVIDPFIQNLTGIRNSQVKKAPRIEEALLHMIDWIGDREYKERYLKQLIVSLYIQATIPNVYFCDEDYKNKCKFDETKKFRQLFNFCFIKASRPLDDDESDHSHMLSKQMIKMVKMDEKWNELVESLPDEVLKPIQEKEIDKAIRSTSLESLKDTIATLEQTNGGKSGELMLDMQISEEDISDLLQRITTATYDIDGYYLGESSQGLGYSNMIYIHLQLKEYEKNIDPLKVNMFFLEEPESHMHPQMQQVFIKYLLDYYESKLQGLITTHWKKYSAVDVMTKDEARINDALLSFLFIVDQIIEYYLQECYGEVFRNIHEYYMYFNSEKYIVEKHRDKKTIKTRLEKIKNSYVDRATTIDGFLNICFKEEFIEEEIYCSIIEDDDYQLVKDVYIEEVRKLTNYLNDPRVSTQHGVKGESHDTVVFVADNSSNPAVHMSKFFEVWSEMNITLREFDAFYYRYSNMIKDIECTMGIKISELKAKSYAAVADMIDTVLKRFISENENNPYYIFLLKPKMEKYKKKKNVTSAKACLNEGTVYGPLCAYRLFYVGCSRARKNLLIIINREDVKNFEDKLYEKLKDCGFEVEY